LKKKQYSGDIQQAINPSGRQPPGVIFKVWSSAIQFPQAADSNPQAAAGTAQPPFRPSTVTSNA